MKKGGILFRLEQQNADFACEHVIGFAIGRGFFFRPVLICKTVLRKWSNKIGCIAKKLVFLCMFRGKRKQKGREVLLQK